MKNLTAFPDEFAFDLIIHGKVINNGIKAINKHNELVWLRTVEYTDGVKYTVLTSDDNIEVINSCVA